MTDFFDFFNCYVMGGMQALTGFYFLTRFLKEKVSCRHYILFGLLWLGVMAVIPDNRVTELLIYGLLLAAGGIFIPAGNGGRSRSFISEGSWQMSLTVLLYAALTVEIMQLCYGIVNSLLSILYPMMSAFDQRAVGIWFMVLGNMALVPAIFCYHAACRYFSWYETVEKQSVLLVFIPILMIFFMEEYMNSVMYDLDSTEGRSGAGVYRWSMLAIRVFGMASLFCIMSAYKKLLQNFCLSKEVSLLEQEEQFLNRYVEEAKDRYDKTRSFRHDIKNHMTVLRELLLKGKTEQAAGYIKGMEEMAEGLSFSCSTNNPAVDILMGNKLGIAESLGIRVNCSLALPYPCSVRDIDFCVILSNALDNGIRACREMEDDGNKYIGVTGRIQGDLILMEVENSFRGSSLVREGTGLANIKAAADKYHGAVSINVKEGVFLLSVLLVIPQQPESISRQNG